MSVVIHDWNDEDALKILRNCRRLIATHGKLVLVESILKTRCGRFNDLTMLVLARGGRKRTEAEFTESDMLARRHDR